MDPDATLATLRFAVHDVLNHSGANTPSTCVEIAVLFDSLDTWIARGGFLPAAWKKPQDDALATRQKQTV